MIDTVAPVRHFGSLSLSWSQANGRPSVYTGTKQSSWTADQDIGFKYDFRSSRCTDGGRSQACTARRLWNRWKTAQRKRAGIELGAWGLRGREDDVKRTRFYAGTKKLSIVLFREDEIWLGSQPRSVENNFGSRCLSELGREVDFLREGEGWRFWLGKQPRKKRRRQKKDAGLKPGATLEPEPAAEPQKRKKQIPHTPKYGGSG